MLFFTFTYLKVDVFRVTL